VVDDPAVQGGDVMSGRLPALAGRGNGIHGGSWGARAVKWTCIGITLLFVLVFLVLPLCSVFYEALRPVRPAFMPDEGDPTTAVGWYWAALKDPNSLHAIKMTLLTAGIAVPFNTIFGIAAAWAIAKFNFRGKSLLITIIDIPFAVSPVISGLIFVLLFGRSGLFGPWLIAHGVKIIFALPGMVLATIFVTFPFVARELIPLMQEQGTQEEQAAISLGASGWQTFWKITLPNIKWGLLYGVILCNARAMGEFGAISVVTQNLPGETNTLPREIEYLYSNYGGLGMRGAFALSSVLAMLGLITLIAKSLLEWKIRRDLESATEGAA
jgi:sulfate transport system permease protein